MNTTNTQDPIKLAPDTKEMKVLAAFLAAMHDQSLDGAKMREAMLWSLGLQPAAAQPQGDAREAFEAWWTPLYPTIPAPEIGPYEVWQAAWQAASTQASEPSAESNDLTLAYMKGFSDGKAAAPARAVEPLTDEQLREEWYAAGGGIHGPNIETVTMRESSYFAFRRSFAAQKPPATQLPRDWHDTIQGAIDELPFQHPLIPRLMDMLDTERAHGIGIPATTPTTQAAQGGEA